MNRGNGNDELGAVVERLFDCSALFLENIAVIEKFGKATAWQGVVSVYRLKSHPTADKCYAWAADNAQTGKRKYYAVLHNPPIDSPEKAVRASIVRDRLAGTI